MSYKEFKKACVSLIENDQLRSASRLSLETITAIRQLKQAYPDHAARWEAE